MRYIRQYQSLTQYNPEDFMAEQVFNSKYSILLKISMFNPIFIKYFYVIAVKMGKTIRRHKGAPGLLFNIKSCFYLTEEMPDCEWWNEKHTAKFPNFIFFLLEK